MLRGGDPVNVLPSNGIPLNQWPPTPPIVRDKKDVYEHAGGTRKVWKPVDPRRR